jgi:hypothetical protein
MALVRTRLTLLALAPALVAPGAADAALYVAPHGSDSGPCTRNAPCRSLERADALAAAGTTVLVAPGGYAQSHLRRSGTRSARIRYRSTTPWGAKITAESGAVVLISGAYVDFAGFEVTGGAGVSSGIALAGSSSRAIGNHVHDIPRPCRSNGGIVAGDARYRSRNIEIVGNWVHDIGAGPRDGSCHLLHGIYAAVPGVRVANNVVARALGDGITSWHAATRLTVVNNTVVGNGGAGILVGHGDAGATGSGNTHSYVANNVIADNAGDAISEGGPRRVFNVFRANTYFGNGGDRVDHWGASVEEGTRREPLTFVGAAVDDYRLLAGSQVGVRGTRIGAPAIDFLGVRRDPASIGRGAYEPLRAPAEPRPPGTPGTLPASSIGAPRALRWPRDAIVGLLYRRGPREVGVAVRLPERAMTVRATATARGLGRIATAVRHGKPGARLRLRLRLSGNAARALRAASAPRLRVEVAVEASPAPPARFIRAVTLRR